MKKLIITLSLILIAFPVMAQKKSVPVDQEAELKKIFAEKLAVEEADVETELQKGAVDAEYQKVIDEITERIRRKKVDEAKAYVPTDEEILAELKIRTSSE